MTLLTLAPGSSLVKTDYEAECLAQPKGQLSSWPSVYALDLTDTWPNRYLSELQTWLMSIIVHADASHVLLEEDDAIPAN